MRDEFVTGVPSGTPSLACVRHSYLSGESIMKKFVALAIAAGVLSAPVLGIAQTSDHAVTHAALIAELSDLEHAGYNPRLGNDPRFPEDLQMAEAKVAAQRKVAQASTDVGGVQAMSASSEPTPHTSSDLHVPFVHR
jgi:hypothetical protein